jgi:methyl-accepting chemotaxis protein
MMRLAEINNIDHLNICAKELNSLGPDTEKEFLGIGETLNKLANICFGMTDDGLKLASVSNFNTVGATAEKQSFIEETRAIFAEVTSHVAKSMESLSEGGQLLQELSERIRRLRGPIQALYSIGKTFRVLGIGIKVESSREKSSTHGFQLLAEEVAAIALLVQNNCRFCIDKANVVERDINCSQQALSGGNKYDNNAEEAIYNILTALEDVGAKSEILAAGIQERSAEMVQGISEVVMAMQFHDITRQQLENVAKSLVDINAKIGASSSGNSGQSDTVKEQDVLEVYTVLSIQAAHLNSIYEQVLYAGRQIETGLGKTMGQAQIQAGDARTLLSLEGHTGSRSVVLSLEKEIDNIVHSLNKALAVVRHAAEISREVYNNVSEIGGFVSKIEKIAFDVKILAINAMAEASKTGGSGRTLIVLAKELSTLSQETREGAAHSIEMLQNIIEGTEQQLEFSANLDQNRAGVDAMIERARALAGTILSSMQEVARLAQKMDNDNRDLASRIVKLIPGIKFTRVMGDRIDRNWQLICQMINHIEEEFPQFLEKSSEVKEMMETLAKQYVMDRERTIHAQITGGTSAAAAAGGDVDLFGDDDFELFDDNLGDAQQAGAAGDKGEQFDDNVELF